MMTLVVAPGETNITDVDAEFCIWLLLSAPRTRRRRLLHALANGNRVISDGHMAVAAGCRHQQIQYMPGLPIRHRRTEFGMQPPQFAGRCLEHITFQWRYIPRWVGTALAAFPSLATIEDLAQGRLEFGAMAVV